MMHASRLRVLVAWTGGTAWEYGRVADHLIDEVQKAACGAPAVTSSEPMILANSRALPTCPVCAVLIDEAAQMHVPPTCDFCIEQFDPRNFDVGLAPKRVAMKASEIFAPSRCFHCEFWLRRVDQVEVAVPDVHRPVIVDGVFYTVGNPVHEVPPRRNRDHLGFGGVRWDIKWDDGRTVTTHNLWHGGAIPEYYRMRLPQLRDNAVFVKQGASAHRPQGETP